MPTPFFPAFRARLAACGRRSAQTVRPYTLAQLSHWLRDLLPPQFLAAEDQGPHSRERVFSLRLTLECFLWQILQFNVSVKGSAFYSTGCRRLSCTSDSLPGSGGTDRHWTLPGAPFKRLADAISWAPSIYADASFEHLVDEHWT
jgi:hypothetical protein